MPWLIFLLTLLLPCLLYAQLTGDPKKGEETYVEKCTLCHGAQGAGWDWSKKVEQPPIPVPDLAKTAPGQSDRFLFDIIKGGGEAVGKTRLMPPFGFVLSDKDVWDLVAYIRTLGAKKK